MSKKLTPFFATRSDLVAIAREVSKVRPVDFVQAGMFESPELEVLASFDDLSTFVSYLVLDQGIQVRHRTVPQRGGGQMYAVDQIENPHTIVLQSGGEHSDHHLVAGQVGTAGGSKQSEDLYALFAKTIRERFEKVKSYYVGPEAAALLDSGARLSATSKSPPTFDLVR